MRIYIYLDILTRAIFRKRELNETSAHNEDMNGQREGKTKQKYKKSMGEVSSGEINAH